MDYQSKFETGLTYSAFLEKYGTSAQQQKWATVHQHVAMTNDQQKLLTGFVREMKILVLAGAWCGDCVNQCPIFDHFAAVNSNIRIRYFDRDDHPDLGQELLTCGGQRVPSVLFLSEDNFVCGRYGDKTLAKFRQLAAEQLGTSCPTGLGVVDQSMLQAVTLDWLNEFERIQLMLRFSDRLRMKYGD